MMKCVVVVWISVMMLCQPAEIVGLGTAGLGNVNDQTIDASVAMAKLSLHPKNIQKSTSRQSDEMRPSDEEEKAFQFAENKQSKQHLKFQKTGKLNMLDDDSDDSDHSINDDLNYQLMNSDDQTINSPFTRITNVTPLDLKNEKQLRQRMKQAQALPSANPDYVVTRNPDYC